MLFDPLPQTELTLTQQLQQLLDQDCFDCHCHAEAAPMRRHASVGGFPIARKLARISNTTQTINLFNPVSQAGPDLTQCYTPALLSGLFCFLCVLNVHAPAKPCAYVGGFQNMAENYRISNNKTMF